MLTHAFDVDGDPLTINIVEYPSVGTLVIGSLIYTPPPNFVGTTTFQYTVSDGTTTSGIATVTMTIGNDAPASGDLARTLAVNTTAIISASGGALSGSFDPDGDTMTVELIATTQHGSLTLNTDGSFIYVPNTDYVGDDSFTFAASDAYDQGNQATYTLHVTDATIIANDDYFEVVHGKTLTIGATNGFLATDYSIAGGTLTAQIVSQPAHGTLTSQSNGAFVYSADATFHGNDSFQYTVSNGTDTSQARTVSIKVTDWAPHAVADQYTAHANASTEFGATTDKLSVGTNRGVLVNDYDHDDLSLTASLVTSTTHGTLVFSANGTFTYQPNPGELGPDQFSYTTSDGTLTSEPVTVTINVTNQAPTPLEDRYRTHSGSPKSGNLLLDDFDADGDEVRVASYSQPQDGQVTVDDAGHFTYTPNVPFAGIDSFTYLLTDGRENSVIATVSIDVWNNVPISNNDTFVMHFDSGAVTTAFSGNVLVNDIDPDNDPLTVVEATEAQYGEVDVNTDGSFVYYPPTGFVGKDTFSYRVSDGTNNSQPVTVKLWVQNYTPRGVEDAYYANYGASVTKNVLDNDVDPDNLGGTIVDSLFVDVDTVTNGAYGTVVMAPSGVFTYTPDVQHFYVLSDSFQYFVTDGATGSPSLKTPVTVKLFFGTPNTNPQDDSVAILQNEKITGLVVSGNDDIHPATDVTFVKVAGPSHFASYSLTTVPLPNGKKYLSLSYTPAKDYVGFDTITYRMDYVGQKSRVATIHIMIKPLSGELQDDYYEVSHSGKLDYQTGPVPSLLANDTPLLFSGIVGYPALEAPVVIIEPPTLGTLELVPATGQFSYKPLPNKMGLDSFKYQVQLGGATATATARIRITNQQPLIGDKPYSTAVGTPVNLPLTELLQTGGGDPDGDALTMQIQAKPWFGTLAETSSGWTYTPQAGFNGTDYFTYTLTDSLGLRSEKFGTIAIKVGAASGQFVAMPDELTIDEDATGNIDVLTNDLGLGFSIGTPTVTVVSGQGPTHGSATVVNGTINYVPAPNYWGVDSLTYMVKDVVGHSSTATLNIRVVGINDIPVAVNDPVSLDQEMQISINAFANDYDADAGVNTPLVPHYVEITATPLHGSVFYNEAEKRFIYRPATGFSGQDTFQYTVYDEHWKWPRSITIQPRIPTLKLPTPMLRQRLLSICCRICTT